MTVDEGRLPSAVLPGPIDYLVYLPPGYQEEGRRYPVLLLLHGRGDSAASWRKAFSLFDALLAVGAVPPFLAVAPDGPWSRRTGYWMDSRFTGDEHHERGAAIATALVTDLLPHVDRTYPTLAVRNARAVCGYSMGGAGALQLVLGHAELFAAAIVLSPAVYDPLPPERSTTRSQGAYGRGPRLFENDRYRECSYPTALATVREPVRLFVGVGADEQADRSPSGELLRPDVQANRLVQRAGATPGVQADLLVVPGGHDWSTWIALLEAGLADIVPRLGEP